MKLQIYLCGTILSDLNGFTYLPGCSGEIYLNRSESIQRNLHENLHLGNKYCKFLKFFLKLVVIIKTLSDTCDVLQCRWHNDWGKGKQLSSKKQ